MKDFQRETGEGEDRQFRDGVAGAKTMSWGILGPVWQITLERKVGPELRKQGKVSHPGAEL